MEYALSLELPLYFPELPAALFLKIGNRRITGVAGKHQATWTERTTTCMTAETALMFTVMTIHELTSRATLRTRRLADQHGSIEEPHRVYPPHRVKCGFQVGETFAIGSRDMFTGVLQRVAESAYKPTMLTFEEVMRRGVNFLFRNPDNLGTVPLCADLCPDFCKYTLRKIRTDVNAMRMKVRVVRFHLAIPSTKLIAPKKSILV